jgi:t-SNARE complex subunit (syntaxin)
MSIVKVENQKHLVRDTTSGAILNTDKSGLQEYYRRKELAKKEIAEREETKQRLAKMEEEMQEIKNLLKEIAMIRKSEWQ